jgi:putative nucleotidyltransferase with HDIG domain
MKKAVLFVDDDVNILQGMKRMLRVMRFKWDMFFAEGGEEALQILSQNHINVIVTDMRMPGMNGAELLAKVRERYPHVIRIVLSGDSNHEMNLLSAKVAHQSLAKPCDADTLRSTIERSCMLQKLLKNEKIAEIVNSISDLPSQPVLYNSIIKEMESPNGSLKKVGDIIAQDVSMTARVLQFVNSAFFGLPQKVTLPQQAVTLLGLDILKGLVLYAQVFSTFKNGSKLKGISVHRFWKHSMMVGTVAREIALSEAVSPKIADESFVAGLLHDMGKLLLYRIPGHFQQVSEYSQAKQCDYRNAEYELLGTSHAEVGAYLLGLWGIPENIVEAVALHHCPGKAMDKQFSILTGVHAANAIIGQSGTPDENTVLSSIDMQYISELNLESNINKWIDCRKKVEIR